LKYPSVSKNQLLTTRALNMNGQFDAFSNAFLKVSEETPCSSGQEIGQPSARFRGVKEMEGSGSRVEQDDITIRPSIPSKR